MSVDSAEQQRQAIVDYMASQAPDEKVEHLEKVASERVMGQRHDIWDVQTNAERWWLISGPTNLYLQKQFPSMDLALTFHVGLMARVMNRERRHVPTEGRQRFARTWRRWQQAADALSEADEPEEFQAVGMRCREAMIAFVQEARTVVVLPDGSEPPKRADAIGWMNLIAETLAPGEAAERRRGYLKATAKGTWEYVQWLTHASGATRFDADLALDATGQILRAYSVCVIRRDHGNPDRCNRCGSYRLRGEHKRTRGRSVVAVSTCEVCGWEDERAMKLSEAEEPRRPKRRKPWGACLFMEPPLRGSKPPEPSR